MVFVLDRNGKPLMPCSEKRARLLLERGRARVHKVYPFTIRVVDRKVADCVLQAVRVKLDPGSKTTGLALVRETETLDGLTGEIQREVAVLGLMELIHRGRQISEALTARRQMRCRRRNNLRYRVPRFLNRGGDRTGWLAPSLQHRVDTTLSWVKRLQRWAPVVAISSELVRFDMQKMESPDIEGVEYQRGTLAGFEIWEYLLAKWNRTCAYCDAVNVPFEKDHIRPRSKSGSDRVSNLCLACHACNQKKTARSIEDFLLKDQPRLKRILAQAKAPLKDAAAVNATRWALANVLKATGLPVELASGGCTKFNRVMLGIPKTHALDALCVGHVASVQGWEGKPTLSVKCTGRGSYQRTRLNKYGFPRTYLTRQKRHYGFATGDMVRATMTTGKNIGVHVGRVAVRATGSFNIQKHAEGKSSVVQGIGHKHCTLIQHADGYGYFLQPANNGRDQVRPQSAQHTEPSAPALYLPGLNPGVSRAFG